MDVDVVLGSCGAVNDAFARLEVVAHFLSGEALPTIAEFRCAGWPADAVGQGFGENDVGAVVEDDVCGLQIDGQVFYGGVTVKVDFLGFEIDPHTVFGGVVDRGGEGVGRHPKIGGVAGEVGTGNGVSCNQL